MAAITVVGVLIVLSGSTATTFLCKEINNHLKTSTCALAVKLNPADWEVTRHQGTAFLALENYEKAIDRFSTALTLNPKDSESLIQRATAYTKTNRFLLAEEDINSAISLSGFRSEPFLLLGELREAMGQNSLAIDAYDQALRINPNEDDARINRARAMAALNKRLEALNELTSFLREYPDSARAYVNRGLIFNSLGRTTDALYDFDRATRLGFHKAYEAKGIFFYNLKEYARAEEAFTKAIARYVHKGRMYLRRGETRYAANNFDGALRDFTTVINFRDDNSARAHALRGNIHAIRGNYDSAVEDYSSALQLFPNDALTLTYRGIIYKELKQYEKSIADFTSAININSTTSLVYENRAYTFIAMGDFHRALLDVEQWVSLAPTDKKALSNRGFVLSALEEYPRAIADFSRVLEIAPNDPYALEQRAIAYEQLRMFEEAISDLNLAISLGKETAENFYRRASNYFGASRFQEALSDISRAIQLDPNDDFFIGTRALMLVATGDHKSAITDLSRLLKNDENDAGNFAARGIAFLYTGNTKRGLEDLNRAIALAPEVREFRSYRAQAYMLTEDYDAALTDIESAFVGTTGMESALSYLYRAQIHHQLGKKKEALNDFRKASLFFPEPSNIDEYLFRGNIYRGLGEYQKAIEDFGVAKKLSPRDIRALDQLGMTFLMTNNWAAALAEFDRAIELNSTNPFLYVNRAIAQWGLGRLDESILDCYRALELAPSNKKAARLLEFNLRNRVVTNLHRGYWRRTIVDLTRLIRIAPEDIELKMVRANAWREIGNYKKAEQEFGEAIKFDPTSAKAYGARSGVRALRGDLDGAIEDITTAIELKPKETIFQKQLNELEYQRGATTGRKDGGVAAKSSEKQAGRRVALIIANANYLYFSRLRNPLNDGKLISRSFLQSGFDEVEIKENLTAGEMMGALTEFRRKASQAAWAVIYFAGHGVEVNGYNFLIPVDVKPDSEGEVIENAIPMREFFKAVSSAADISVLIFDACRESPFERRGFERYVVDDVQRMSVRKESVKKSGLARVEPEPGTVVMFSAMSGQTALDGRGKNSPFAAALASRITEIPSVELRKLVAFVGDDVALLTNRQQQPFTYGYPNPRQDFYFKRD